MRLKIDSKKIFALILSVVLVFQIAACGAVNAAKQVANSAKDAAIATKDAMIKWYEGVDMTAFKDGWDNAAGAIGTAYSIALSSEYW